MIRIGIIDSGIEYGLVTKNSIVYRENFLDEDLKYAFDESGHGTCIVKQIDFLCHDCELYIFKILNSINETSFSVVDRAMQCAYSLQLDIINMSFGIECECYIENISKRCEEFKNQNAIVVTTASNSGVKNYLYEQENVIRVVGGRSLLDDSIIYTGEAFCTKGIPRMLPWLNDTYILKGGNSFSTAPIIKMICDAKSNGRNTLEEVKNFLISNVKYDSDYAPFIYPLNIEKEKIIDNDLFHKTLSLLKNECGIMDNTCLFAYPKIANCNFQLLLEWLGEKLNFPVRMLEYQYNHLFYIENLSNKIFNEMLISC